MLSYSYLFARVGTLLHPAIDCKHKIKHRFLMKSLKNVNLTAGDRSFFSLTTIKSGIIFYPDGCPQKKGQGIALP